MMFCASVKILRPQHEQEWAKTLNSKKESTGPPKTHLGGHLQKVTLENGAKAWSFSLSQCVQASVKNVEDCVSKQGWKLPRTETPLSTVCRPELDVTAEQNETDSAHCFFVPTNKIFPDLATVSCIFTKELFKASSVILKSKICILFSKDLKTGQPKVLFE